MEVKSDLLDKCNAIMESPRKGDVHDGKASGERNWKTHSEVVC